MNIEFFTDLSEFTTKEINYFRRSGISLDDWDYMLFFPADILQEYEVEEEDWSKMDEQYGTPTKIKIKKYTPKNWYVIDRLLNGYYKNEWYKINFRGRDIAMGIAYHG